jgi:colanic acid/amylovoran biosynthesis glycosyltransferase
MEPVPHASPEQPLRVLTVGRLVPDKGHAVLLEAIAQLERRGVPVVAEIVGGGAELAGLRRRAADLGIEHQVEFAGELAQDAIRQRYAAADVFCLPSLGEGLPVSLMEAFASELPVVASRIAGIPELVDHGVSGLLLPPGRADAIAAAVETLAGSPEVRRRMGRAGRSKVMNEYRIERSGDRLWELFSQVLGQPQNGRAAAGEGAEDRRRRAGPRASRPPGGTRDRPCEPR